MDHAKHLHMNIICQNLAIAHSAGIHCFFFLFDAIFKPTGVIQKQHSLCATEPEQSIVQNSLPQCDSGFCSCQIVSGQLCRCASGSLCFFTTTVYPGS